MNATRYLVSTRREVGLPAFFFVLAFTFSHYVALSERLSIMATLRNEMLLGVACLVIAAGVMMSDPMSLGAGKRVVLSFAVFLVMVLIQVPFAMDHEAAAFMFENKVLKQSIFTLFIAVLLRSPRHIAWFLATYLFALFWIFQEAVRGLISGSLVWYNQGIQRLHGSVPRYQHPNGLSLASLSSLPFLYYMRRVWTKRWMQLAMLACLVLAMLCIVNTGSRAGYVGVVAGVGVIWLASKNKVRSLLVIIVLAIGAAVMMPDQYLGRFESITGEEQEGMGASKHARMQLMSDAWEIFQEYPLGVGVDSFIYVRMLKFSDRHAQDVHTLYLQILTHLGAQGMVAFIWLIVTLFQCQIASLGTIQKTAADLRRGLRQDRIPADRYVRRFLSDLRVLEMSIRSIRFFMIMMLFNGLFAHTVYHILWYFIVGVSIATAATAEHLAEVTRRFWIRLQREQLTAETSELRVE